MNETAKPVVWDAGLSKHIPDMIARYGHYKTAEYLCENGVSLDDAYFMMFGKKPSDGDIEWKN
jgi:hypothetical protein